MNKHLKTVQAFWNTEACGTHFIEDAPGTAGFYEKYRGFRYQTEWHIQKWVPFQEAKGKKILEIGCGNGADGVLFAEAGAYYTGVDLTEAAVTAAQKHFTSLNLPAKFQVENAETLSFPDTYFDWVYSYGVLHHTAHPEKTFQEVFRVLKPGGRAYLMLYHKNSFNYYVRIMFYMRLRCLIKIFSRFGRWQEDRQKNAFVLHGLRGNQSPKIWDIHYQNFLKEGWPYLKAKNFVHHCTDGPECPYAFVFTQSQVKNILGFFRSVQCCVYHFPIRKYSMGKWVPRAIETFLAKHLGWYLCISLEK
ncbi:MAG: hypothetical protein A3H42_04590 [Deltaproteobacteria bacterium RIFCSPLOWO2_02_FULL_46_8]|nr:MAG: hypothetical protein A3H42_04590 [Deltaproteobacteria bacterium RIFCSPLOWO2_02_FULL_46_8]